MIKPRSKGDSMFVGQAFSAQVFLRRLVSTRIVLVVLLAAGLLGVAVPSACARKREVRRHSKLRVVFVHGFVNVSLPGIGTLPLDEEALPSDGERYELRLARAHTNEMIDVIYRIGDTYVPEALDKLNQFLRDSHNEEVRRYDPRAFDVLHTLVTKLGRPSGVIDILSGYRSQETNDMLRESKTTNAARYSEHIFAKAFDIRVPGVPATLVRDAALSLEAGGVGYYPQGQFVHVDIGPVRRWIFAPHADRKRSHRRRPA
jgi:uncharacterized protein YcbK (DUF882 family)